MSSLPCEKLEEPEEESVIPFKLDRNGFGSLTRTKTPVWANKCNNHEDYNRALKISHPNFLHCFFYDDKRGLMFHIRYDDKLETYIEKKLADEKIVDVYRREIISGKDPGRKINHMYLNPVYRLLFKSMLRFVVDQQMGGYSLTKFSMENIVIVDGVAMFAGVGLRTSSEETRREDFLCMSQIADKMFGNTFKNTQLPLELKNLLGLIKNPPDCTRVNCGLVMFYHMVIMSPRESVQFMISCNERVPFLDDDCKTKYKKALSKLPNWNNWSNRFSKSNKFYTNACFNSKEHKKNYRFKSSKHCSNDDVKASLLRCCRNMAVHLQNVVPKNRRSELDIENMIIPVFGKELYSFHRELHDYECLLPFVMNS